MLALPLPSSTDKARLSSSLPDVLWNFLEGASARRKHCSACVICDTSNIRGPSEFRICCRAVQHLRASVVKRVIPAHGSNWTTVFKSILTELVRLVDEYSYVCWENDLLNWMTYG